MTTSSAPAVSVVVLTYRSASTLAACLDSVRPELAQLDGQLIVVDNGSPDDTVAIARSLGVEPVETGENLGFAAGCNRGAREATGDLLVFVNPDAVLDRGALRALVDAAAAEARRGPLGGRAHGPDGAYDRRSVHGRPTLRGALSFSLGLGTAMRGATWADPERGPRDVTVDGPPRDVVALSGALLAVPRPLWDLLGGFDERFFLYGEDIDLCLRAADLGWRPTLVTAAGYGHVGGVSSDGSGGVRDVLLYRGKVELYRQHLGPVAARAAVVALQFGVLLRGLPAKLPVERVAQRARPWWQLFGARRTWRQGYPTERGRPVVSR